MPKTCPTCGGDGTIQSPVEKLAEVAREAIDYVGVANYNERQAEAHQMVDKCVEELEDEEEEEDETSRRTVSCSWMLGHIGRWIDVLTSIDSTLQNKGMNARTESLIADIKKVKQNMVEGP